MQAATPMASKFIIASCFFPKTKYLMEGLPLPLSHELTMAPRYRYFETICFDGQFISISYSFELFHIGQLNLFVSKASQYLILPNEKKAAECQTTAMKFTCLILSKEYGLSVTQTTLSPGLPNRSSRNP
jgi:hypothetical protein